MSAAEIADNRWEMTATKPPITSFGGILMILLMGGFSMFFLWIIVFSAVAIVTPKKDAGLAADYAKMGMEGTKAE